MASNLTEYLTEIQELTKKNFELLKALNDSFNTKSEHLSVSVGNDTYVIPSFLALENKINTLEDDFQNLVNAPKTGEAAFNFNGNTQTIEMKGFTNVPQTAFEGLDMNSVSNIKNFETKKNEIFKDFLTPTPYVKIDLSNLPDDIQSVNVKKIALRNSELVSILKSSVGITTENMVCKSILYSDVVKKLYNYVDGTDYVMYDKVYSMPIRYELGSGTYKILSIDNDWTDEDFFEHYKLKLDNISYVIADETIQRNIKVGNYLVTSNDRVKLLIESVDTQTNRVQVKIENGGFADLCTVNSGNSELSTLKFFANGSINSAKYLEIPLEEDEYVLVFLAPIQRASLIQSAWKNGLFFDVYSLQSQDGVSYKNYYDQFVTNVGDKLFGLVSMSAKDFENVSKHDFEALTTAKPEIDTNAIKVSLINKHMSNSETVQEIYDLYKQKQTYKTDLNNVQSQIDELNNILSSLSFEDAQSNKTVYEQSLSSLKQKKSELVKSISDTIQQIYTTSVDTDTPVENPKYHIRGFFDYESYLKALGIDNANVIKIDVQYRYKNANKATGNAESIGTNIFSDWNIMQSELNPKLAKANGVSYTYNYLENTSAINVPSFNQIDIPISQGESVDIRLRVVYEQGYPFVQCTSDWSEIVNVPFPDELKKNITVLDILKENNSDTQKESLRSYLQKEGIVDHVSDTLQDQNITYLHTPDKIASGFYTDERRVIPLKDKLQSLTNDITELKDEVYGISSENLSVTISDGVSEMEVSPYKDNTFVLQDFTSASKESEVVNSTITLKIQNNSKTNAVKLFSMFPGNMNSILDGNVKSKFIYTDYYLDVNASQIANINYINSASAITQEENDKLDAFEITNNPDGLNNSFEETLKQLGKDGIIKSTYKNVNNIPLVGTNAMELDNKNLTISSNTIAIEPWNSNYTTDAICVPIYVENTNYGNEYHFMPQVQNQWLYFRINDAYTNEGIYVNAFSLEQYKRNTNFGASNNKVITEGLAEVCNGKNLAAYKGMNIFAAINDLKDICISSIDNANYKIIYPGEALQISFVVQYSLSADVNTVIKNFAFDIRNSLYNDPLNYKFSIKANYTNNQANNVLRTRRTRYVANIIN